MPFREEVNGRHEALWYLAALPTQTMCLTGVGKALGLSSALVQYLAEGAGVGYIISFPCDTDVLSTADFKINNLPSPCSPPQNHWAYFLSPSQDMLIPAPCTPSDLLCHHELWGTAWDRINREVGVPL